LFRSAQTSGPFFRTETFATKSRRSCYSSLRRGKRSTLRH